jgi:curved DNA-binding protein CbpA
MDIEQAFKILGIPPNSSPVEISQAYHEKSLKLHPDIPGGDHKEQSELNEAHDIGVAYAKIRNAVKWGT